MKKTLLRITSVLIITISLSYAFYNFGFANGTENGNEIGYENGFKVGFEKGNNIGFINGYEKVEDNMINMNKVVDFKATETGLYLYMENGDSYYWEK